MAIKILAPCQMEKMQKSKNTLKSLFETLVFVLTLGIYLELSQQNL
jgi:hypothetical protein